MVALRCFTAVFIFVFVQNTSQKFGLSEKICGKSKRDWVQLSWKESMGNGQSCISGKSFRFSADQTLTIIECIDGIKTVRRVSSWKIIKDNADDKVIEIDHVAYLVLFNTQDKGSLTRMRLRTLNFDKTRKSEVIDLSYEKD